MLSSDNRQEDWNTIKQNLGMTFYLHEADPNLSILHN